jgi:6-phosphogluconate dehydrogenase
VDDSGEGRWTVQQAIDTAVPVPVIAAALFQRFASRRIMRSAIALRSAQKRFGGHATHALKGEATVIASPVSDIHGTIILTARVTAALSISLLPAAWSSSVLRAT